MKLASSCEDFTPDVADSVEAGHNFMSYPVFNYSRIFNIIVEYEDFASEMNKVMQCQVMMWSMFNCIQQVEQVSASFLLDKLKLLNQDFSNFQVFYMGLDNIYSFMGTVPYLHCMYVPVMAQNSIYLKVRKASKYINNNEVLEQQNFNEQPTLQQTQPTLEYESKSNMDQSPSVLGP